jgi:hypothetical protein
MNEGELVARAQYVGEYQIFTDAVHAYCDYVCPSGEVVKVIQGLGSHNDAAARVIQWSVVDSTAGHDGVIEPGCAAVAASVEWPLYNNLVSYPECIVLHAGITLRCNVISLAGGKTVTIKLLLEHIKGINTYAG